MCVTLTGLSSSDKYLKLQRAELAKANVSKKESSKKKKKHAKGKKGHEPSDDEDERTLASLAAANQHFVSNVVEAPEVRLFTFAGNDGG
jgi:hypothetical protein